MRAGALPLVSLLAFFFLAVAPAAQKQKAKADIAWTDATKLDVEGRGWPGARTAYARLPEKAEQLVRKEVWRLSRNSAGLAVRFRTDATEVHARWELTGKNL